jgi:hypothetical protein
MHMLAIAPDNTAAFDVDPDGTMVLRSQKKHAVAVRPLTTRFWSDLNYVPSFSVIVTNQGTGNLNLGVSDVTAYSGDVEVAVLDGPALQSEIALANARLPTSGGGHDASQSAQPVYQYPENRSLPRYEVPNPTDPKRTALQVPTPPPLARTLNEMLRRQSIPPGESGGGRVMLDSRDIHPAVPLTIVVKVDGEKHTFLFSVKD